MCAAGGNAFHLETEEGLQRTGALEGGLDWESKQGQEGGAYLRRGSR